MYTSVSDIHDLGFTQSSRVLIFMPHPDDEAVFVSGIIQHLLSQNIPVRCITFTRGEQSTLRYTIKPTDNLATARAKEQTAAYHQLGVIDFDILKFPDGELETLSTPIKQKISQEIASYKATHCITLEPDGIYGHPDHIALSKFVTQSVKQPINLLYATVSPHFMMPSARHMAKKAVIQPIMPNYRLKLSFVQSLTKIRTLLCHKTQFLHFPQSISSLIFFLRNDMLFHEYYYVKKEQYD